MAADKDEYKKWFDDKLKLPQYYELFKDEGYDDMSYLYQFDIDNGDRDLKEIGVKKQGHRRRILSQIQKLHDEAQQSKSSQQEEKQEVVVKNNNQQSHQPPPKQEEKSDHEAIIESAQSYPQEIPYKEEKEQAQNSTKSNEREERENWKIGVDVQIYHSSKQKWVDGKIIDIVNDYGCEWLKIKYGKTKYKEIGRYSLAIRPLNQKKHKIAQQRRNRDIQYKLDLQKKADVLRSSLEEEKLIDDKTFWFRNYKQWY